MTAALALWAVAFGATCLVEVPVYLALVGDRFRSPGDAVVRLTAVNLVTHPVLWFGRPGLVPWAAWVAGGEVAVALAEGLLLAAALGRSGWRRWLAAALVANALSLVAGAGLALL